MDMYIYMMIHIISTVWIPIWSIAFSYHNRLRRSASRGGLSRAIPTIRPGTQTQGIFCRDRLLSLTTIWMVKIIWMVITKIFRDIYIIIYIYVCFLYFRANPILIILLLGPFIPPGLSTGWAARTAIPSYPMTLPPLSVSRCVPSV